MKTNTSKFLFFNLFILIFVLNIFETKLLAQNQYNFKQFINEGGDLVKQPVKWNLGDWLTFGGLAAGSYAIMHFDENIRKYYEYLKDKNQYIMVSIKVLNGHGFVITIYKTFKLKRKGEKIWPK